MQIKCFTIYHSKIRISLCKHNLQFHSPLSTSLQFCHLLSSPLPSPTPTAPRLQGTHHGQDQQSGQPKLHLDGQTSTDGEDGPLRLFILYPLDEILTRSRGCYFEEIVYILMPSVNCQMFSSVSPPSRVLNFAPSNLLTIVYL